MILVGPLHFSIFYDSINYYSFSKFIKKKLWLFCVLAVNWTVKYDLLSVQPHKCIYTSFPSKLETV